MANNRMYIVDDETGEQLMVAKSFGGGWDWRKNALEMTEWLAARDLGAAYGGPSGMSSTRLRLVTEYDLPKSGGTGVCVSTAKPTTSNLI